MRSDKVTLQIELKTIIRFLAALVIFGFFVLALYKLSAILIILVIAFFLALALNPPVSRLASFLPGHNRILATAIAYVVVLVVLGSLVYVAVPPVVQQTNSFIENFPSYISTLSHKQGSLSNFIHRYELQDEINQFIAQLQNGFGNIAKGFGSTLVSGVTTAVTGIIAIVTILVATFLMLIEGPLWVDRLWKLYSSKRKLNRDKRLLTQMYHVVTGYVNGQVLIAAIASVSVFVVLFVLAQIFSDVPFGIVLPLVGVAFISSLIPLFGATIAAIIITLVLLLNSIPAAAIFLVYYLIYQQIENNVIQPVVQARTVQLTALAVFIAAVTGIALLGVVGAIIAIPVAGSIRILLNDYLEHREDYLSNGNHKKLEKSKS